VTAPTPNDGRLLTVGHGTLGRDELGPLLREAGVDELVDVRRFPGSRNNPDVGRDALEAWVPAAGLAYRWEQRLGGRRRLAKDEENLDGWWRVTQFSAYAGYTRTPDFREALAELLAAAAQRTVAVMCSEAVWWRCHRRLIADVVTLGHHTPVWHLMHTGKLTEHPPAEGARVRPDGLLVWDGR
jgi:uncharacterized protein (DUF488 family)